MGCREPGVYLIGLKTQVGGHSGQSASQLQSTHTNTHLLCSTQSFFLTKNDIKKDIKYPSHKYLSVAKKNF